MAGDWPEAIWSDIAELKYGKAMTAYTDQPNVARVYGTNGPIGWHNTALQPGPGVIVGRKGAYRGVHYTDQPFWVIDTAYYLKPLVPMDLRWAYYWLLDYDVNNIDDGSPIPSTTREAFGFTPLKFPPLDEQARIGDLLSSLDAKIDLNRQMAATLEDMVRALFKSWFVDFDPVHAKSEGRDTGLPADIAELFPNGFNDEGLPTGWARIKYGNACSSIYSGGTPTTGRKDFWNGGIPWLSSGETRNHFIVTTEKTISEMGASNSSTRLAPAMATVVATAGQGATRGQTSILGFDTYINQSTAALLANKALVSNAYLYTDMSGRYDELRAISDSQSSRGSLTTKILADLNIVSPTHPVVSAFTAFADATFEQIFEIERSALTLIDTRKSLLPKLLSGELRVDDATDSIAAA